MDRSAKAWLTDTDTPAGQKPSETSRLDRLGFVAGASEQLTGSGGLGGVSLVEQFRSAGAARAEMAAEVQRVKNNDGGYYSPFPVTGIPGARGLGENGSPPGINVAFTSGDYYYLVGEQPPSVTAGAEHSLNAAAQHLYQRLKALDLEVSLSGRGRTRCLQRLNTPRQRRLRNANRPPLGRSEAPRLPPRRTAKAAD